MTERDMRSKRIAVDLINSFCGSKDGDIFTMLEVLTRINMLERENSKLHVRISKNKSRIKEQWNELDELTTRYMEAD